MHTLVLSASSPGRMIRPLLRQAFSRRRLIASSYAGQKRVINGEVRVKPALKKYQKMADIQGRFFSIYRCFILVCCFLSCSVSFHSRRSQEVPPFLSGLFWCSSKQLFGGETKRHTHSRSKSRFRISWVKMGHLAALTFSNGTPYQWC